MSRVGPLLCSILVGRDDLLDLAERRTAAGIGRGRLAQARCRNDEAAGRSATTRRGAITR